MLLTLQRAAVVAAIIGGIVLLDNMTGRRLSTALAA